MFNARSCVACHQQGGVGGGGDNLSNVDLLSLKTPPEDVAALAKKARREPLRLHPLFVKGQATIILHAESVYSDYQGFRQELLGLAQPPNQSPVAKARYWAIMAKRQRTATPTEDVLIDGVHLQRTQRNTPALFGAGLIDEIRETELVELEKRQADKRSKVSGRVGRARGVAHDPFAVADGGARQRFDQLGKFGWRGQTVNLADFVLGACANEVGLSMPQHQQALDPLRPQRDDKQQDLNNDQCRQLIEFVRSLPRPRQIRPSDERAAREAARGEALMSTVGCVDCHQPALDGIDGLYSDLLLHDMGPGLFDPLPAMPQIAVVGTELSPGYYGGIVTRDLLAKIPTEIHQEWRTPPLWGVADSGPYLHDGRAPTLHQAIMLHGGEASDSQQRYARLNDAERHALLAFLGTLRAPR
jgi:CxxC motif-containing protein (DUF1111 family)